MMHIENILTEERTHAHISSGSKKRVLEYLANIFSDSMEELDADTLFKSFINRERLGSTGIGSGVAIPHCRCKALNNSIGACITLDHAIDFDSVDNKPIDLVFAMLVPENTERNHLETLASLAEQLQKPNFVAELRKANTNEQLFSAVINSD